MIRAAEEPAPVVEVELGDPVAAPRAAMDVPAKAHRRVGKIVDFQEREARNRALGVMTRHVGREHATTRFEVVGG
jgi:hypothetical protein